MRRRKKKTLIGKYVCYGDEDGGFRWGKIASECVMNTIDGPKDAMVLEGNMSCASLKGHIERHDGPRILRKDIIDMEADILDNDGSIGNLDDDDLFRVSMGDMSAMALGAKNMAIRRGDVRTEVADVAAGILKKRMGMEI